jgi:hypothetical protein
VKRALLGAVLAVLVLAGCDVMGSSKSTGPPPKTLSRARFVRAANRACARAERLTRKMKHSTNFSVIEAEERKIFIPAQERLLVTLRGLNPPPRDAAGFQRWLGTFDQLDVAIHRLLDAFDARQVRQVTRLAHRLEVLGRRFDSQAARLGLRTCAKD